MVQQTSDACSSDDIGANLNKTRLLNGVWAWTTSPAKYVKEAVRNCIVHLLTNYGGEYRMPKKVENLFKVEYDTKLDTRQELDPNKVWYYLTIIGILRWMIKLGRIHIMEGVLLLSSH